MVDLTDVSLVDEDTNSILADDTNRAIPGNLEMHERKSCLVRKSYLVRKIYPVLWEKVVSFSTKFQNFHQVSESWPNFRISTKFQNLDQISESQPNFRISTKFPNLDKISEFWPNFRILTKFNNLDHISQFWPNFRISIQHLFQ